MWKTVEEMIDAEAIDILVLDSIGALQTLQEDQKDINETTVAALAKKINTMVKKFYKATEESKLTVIVMNQEYTNIQTFGYGAPPKVLKGGTALKYGKAVSLEIKKSYSKTNATIETVNGEEMMTEVAVEYVARKNKLGAPMRSATTLLNVNREVNKTFKYSNDVINYATKFGIIQKAGSWYKALINGEERKFQGVEGLNDFVENDANLYTDLKLACYSYIYQPYEFFFHYDYLKQKLKKENDLLKEDKRREVKYMEDLSEEEREDALEYINKECKILEKPITDFLTPLQLERAIEELEEFYGTEKIEALKNKNLCLSENENVDLDSGEMVSKPEKKNKKEKKTEE